MGFTGMGQVGFTHMLEYKCVYSRRCSAIGLLLQTHQQRKLLWKGLKYPGRNGRVDVRSNMGQSGLQRDVLQGERCKIAQIRTI